MQDLTFAELKTIAELKVEIAKTETHVWQRLATALSSALAPVVRTETCIES